MCNTLQAAIACSLISASVLHAQVRGASAGTRAAIPMCRASDLSLGTDAENGSFDGMSHSGTLLVVRNLGPVACTVPARPELTFLDGVKQGSKPLPLKLEIPGSRFMHPGPVMLPVVIAPQAEVTSKLRWVSGEVYEQSVCYTPAAIAIAFRGESQQTPLTSRMCGDRTKGVTYEQTPLVPDPRSAF